MRVAVLDDIHHAYEKQPAMQRLRERAEVRIFTEPFGDPEALRGFDALIANRERTRFTRELLERLPDLKIIAQTGGHAYHIDFEAIRERGIVVGRAMSTASSPPSNGTVELTFGLMIALVRQIAVCDAAIKRGQWPTPLGIELSGKTLGVVGMGNLGTRVAKTAEVFGMRRLAWSRSLTAERAQAVGAEMRDLDDLLREADIVTVHVALSPTSRGLIDARRIGLMKPTAYLINTSRGPIVEEAAIMDALRSGRLAGVALDVYDQEPLPTDHLLRSAPNILLTPHLGYPTDNGYRRFAEGTVNLLLDYLDGKPVAQFEHN